MTRASIRRAATGAAVVVALLWAISADAVDLRGRVDARNPSNGSNHPLANAEVLLVSQGRMVMRTITGYDGFYYFQNATPGPYQLVVNKRLRVNVTILQRTFQDLPPILFVP